MTMINSSNFKGTAKVQVETIDSMKKQMVEVVKTAVDNSKDNAIAYDLEYGDDVVHLWVFKDGKGYYTSDNCNNIIDRLSDVDLHELYWIVSGITNDKLNGDNWK